ncbi:glycosyltransferase [Microbacterium esteraromaticum]
MALLAVRFALGRNVRIAGDLHTGVFTDKKWRWAIPLVMRLIGRDGVAIVTNESLAKRVRSRNTECFVVHDLIERVDVEAIRQKYVLVPLAYAHDEPLKELLEAARMRPDIEWRLTGRAPRWMIESAPRNVAFLGFLPEDDYWRQFDEAGVIGALTTEEDTMQRAGYEALSRGKALVTTDRLVLREYFGDAAVLANPTASGLADAVQSAIAEIPRLESAMKDRRAQKLAEQDGALLRLMAWVTEGGDA